jgi:hypothetical protein
VLDTFGTEIDGATLIVTGATQETSRKGEYSLRVDSR